MPKCWAIMKDVSAVNGKVTQGFENFTLRLLSEKWFDFKWFYKAWFTNAAPG